MSYWNPDAPRLSRRQPEPVETNEKEYTLEEEIMRMEKHRREMIRKIGGDKYNRLLSSLIRKKQQKSRNRGRIQ